MKNIAKILSNILFGGYSKDGYYKEDNDSESHRQYVFSSVFPNQQSMDIAMSIKSSIKNK